MSAGRYSFIIEQGSTLEFEIQYKDSNGDPVDLTNYSARMQIRPTVTSDDVICSLTSTLQSDGTGLDMSGSTSSNPPTSGSIGVYISAYSSSQFASGSNPVWTTARYDLEIVSGSGVATYVDRILEGTVKLSNEITRNGNP
jgi:hypothetical protein